MPRPLGPPAAPGTISMLDGCRPSLRIVASALGPARIVSTDSGIMGATLNHVAPLLAPHAALARVSEPRVRLADVPVLERGWHAQRLAPRAPGQPRGRRRGPGLRRGE